jgi:hypothetical protein
MITPHCCGAVSRNSGSHVLTSFSRRLLALFRWIVPGTVLALLPKCPACLAAYLLAATGFGISLPVATNLRLLLIVLCVASLLVLAAQGALRVVKRRRAHHGAAQTILQHSLPKETTS